MICPKCNWGTLIDYTKGDYLCNHCGASFTEHELDKMRDTEYGAFC